MSSKPQYCDSAPVLRRRGVGRRIGWMLTASALLPAWPLSAEMVSVVGGSLRVYNPSGPSAVTVTAQFLGDQGSLFTEELYLDAPSFLGPIFNNQSTPLNATANLGSFLPDTVLFIRNQSFLLTNPSDPGSPASINFGWFTGNGNVPLNPDHLPHAVMRFDPTDPSVPVTVGFEDLFGGGDMDFNDAVYSFTNVRVSYIDTALSPTVLNVGDSVFVDSNESRYLAEFDSSFSSAGDINSFGSITNYGVTDNDGSLTTWQHLLNDFTGTMNNNSGGKIDNQGQMHNFGTINNDGELSNSSDMLNNGVIESTGSVVNNATGAIVNQSVAAVNVLGTFFNGQDATVINSGSISISGSIQNVGSITNQAAGSITNTASGAWQNLGGFFNNDQATVDNAGSLTNQGMIQNTGSILNQATGMVQNTVGGAIQNIGTWVDSPGAVTDNEGSFVNGGNYSNQSGASMTGGGDYTQVGDAVTTINGVLSQSTVNIQGGVLKGAGMIEGFLNVTDGTVSPGNSPGTLSVDGDFELDGGALQIDLAALDTFDVLNITGQATFSAGNVMYVLSYTPELGDSFVYLTADGGIINFDNLTFSTQGPIGGLSLETHVEGNSLVVTAVPEPAALGALAIALLRLGTARRRSRR